jgi:hypothetical protein
VKDKINNVKAKIDNVKAKIQDKDKKPWSRSTLARLLVLGQLAASPTSFSLEESLRLARQVSALHDKSPSVRPRLVCRPGRTTRASPLTHMEERISKSCKIQQLAAMQTARLAKSVNAGLTSCAAITSPSSPTLPHASSARGTQEPSTVHSNLDLGSGMESYGSTRADRDKPKLLGEEAKHPGVNSPARPRGSSPQRGITTWLQCTLANSDVRRDVPAAKHCNSFLHFPLCPSTCDYKRERKATVTRVRPS